MEISLQEITKDNIDAVLRLKVHQNQEQLVADNAYSIAQGTYSDLSWFRAVYADDQPVGFVMLELDTGKAQYYLWRYMIGKQHQGNGYGRKALELVIAFVRQQPNAKQFLLSYVPTEGSPGPFYSKLGFVETGEVEHGEHIMSLKL